MEALKQHILAKQLATTNSGSRRVGLSGFTFDETWSLLTSLVVVAVMFNMVYARIILTRRQLLKLC